MPTVVTPTGVKRFPYTKAGEAAARRAAKKLPQPRTATIGEFVSGTGPGFHPKTYHPNSKGTNT